MKLNKIILAATLLTVASCGTVSHYGRRPDFSSVSMGMTQQDVIAQLGKPDEIAANNGVVYLKYISTPWYDHNGADGNSKDYFVRLRNNRVDSFGKLGDFDSTRNPEQTINLNTRQL